MDHEQAVARQPCETVTTAATSPTFCFGTAYIHRAASNNATAFLFPASDNIAMAKPGALLPVVFLMRSSTQQNRQYWVSSIHTLRTHYGHSRKFIPRSDHRFEAESDLHSRRHSRGSAPWISHIGIGTKKSHDLQWWEWIPSTSSGGHSNDA